MLRPSCDGDFPGAARGDGKTRSGLADRCIPLGLEAAAWEAKRGQTSESSVERRWREEVTAGKVNIGSTKNRVPVGQSVCFRELKPVLNSCYKAMKTELKSTGMAIVQASRE